MTLKNTFDHAVGVVGGGSFGAAVANLLALNNKVILYIRDKQKAESISKSREGAGFVLHENIVITNSLEEIGVECEVIFPIVPSANFREMIRDLAPYLKPYHILIHGTKGLDLKSPNTENDSYTDISRVHVKTMSEVIREETSILRIGCLAGPNLAREIHDGLPAATVVASHFGEVIEIGRKLLKNDRFMVYGNNDLIGVEFCGVLKNIIAIASGCASALDLGENARSLLISRGVVEMIHIGNAMGGNTTAFLGLAGMGDVIATSTSKLSRNFTVGYRLGKGETMKQISASMEEVAEGVNTVKIVKHLAENCGIRTPITTSLYKILEGETSCNEAIDYLMRFPASSEIDFI